MSTAREIPLEVYGAARVLEPTGALAQGARRLDAAPPRRDFEIELAVDTLCLDSTSFRQLVEFNGARAEGISQDILRIVGERGKIHNPVTDSGGILSGTVRSIGSAYRDPPALGQRVVSLGSLTLSPLSLEHVGPVDVASPLVPVRGTAYLSWLIPWAPFPRDLPFEVAVAALDVGNAPVQTRELISERTRVVLILGAGHAGLLAMAAAREALGAPGRVVVMDASPSACELAVSLGLCDEAIVADLRDPLGALEQARRHGVPPADLTVVLVNATHCEMTAMALTGDEGTVLFFSMATNFSRVALGSESVATTARLVIGSGYAADRGDYALMLLSRHPALRDALGARST